MGGGAVVPGHDLRNERGVSSCEEACLATSPCDGQIHQAGASADQQRQCNFPAISRRYRAIAKACKPRVDLVQDCIRNADEWKARKAGQLAACLGRRFVFNPAQAGAKVDVSRCSRIDNKKKRKTATPATLLCHPVNYNLCQCTDYSFHKID